VRSSNADEKLILSKDGLTVIIPRKQRGSEREMSPLRGPKFDVEGRAEFSLSDREGIVYFGVDAANVTV